MVISAFLLLALQQGQNAGALPLKTHQYTVERGKHALRLDLPEKWQVTDERTSPLTTIDVKPEEGDAFDLLLSPVPFDAHPNALSDPRELQLAVQRQAAALLSLATETELKMVEVKSRFGIGYFFKLTDKRERLPKGEYRYMCQGIMSLGRIRLSVTLLRRDPDEALLMQILTLLQKAQYVSLEGPGGAAAPSTAQQTDTIVGQSFQIAPGHVLELAVPPEWQVVSTRDGRLYEITVKPTSGDAFDMTILPMFYRTRDDQFSSESEIVAYLRYMSALMGENAVEAEIPISRFPNEQGAGYFFRFTDKRETPPTAPFRHMCQAFLVLEHLRLSVAIRLKEPDTVLFNQIIGVLEGARRRNR